MTNLIRTTTDLALHIAGKYAFPGSVIVDATCGNGHDTLALAATNPSKLYAFDIQPSAVDTTKKALIDGGYGDLLKDGTVSIICDSHVNMHRYVNEPVNLIVFNLGYLPGGDKTITTNAVATGAAVSASLDLLSKDGLLCITMYSGHPQGAEEKETLLSWSESLDSRKYHAAFISFINQHNNPPEVLLVTKKL